MSDFRPFCCVMSEATEDEIRNLHKMCVDAGAKEYESCTTWVSKRDKYRFMGVDRDKETFSYSDPEDFSYNILTLDQVEDYLGLPTTNNSVTSTSVKWTKAMQKKGIPLTVGMLALDDNIDKVRVDYEGRYTYFITYMSPQFGIPERTVNKSTLLPFPDEETPEQFSQRTEFLSTFKGFLSEDPFVHEGDGVAKDMYDKLKHLFKY